MAEEREQFLDTEYMTGLKPNQNVDWLTAHDQRIINAVIEMIDGYKVIDGISFDGSLPPADVLTDMMKDTNMIRANVNGVLDILKRDLKTTLSPKE